MSAASNDGRGRWVAGVIAGALLCGGAACATSGSSADAQGDVAVLSDVHVEQRGEDTVVELRGVGNPLHTVVPEADGSRLVVNLSATQPQGVPDGIAPVAGLVEEIDIAPMVDAAGDPYTQVAMHVDGPVDYEVLTEEGGLAVRVWAAPEDDGQPAAPAPAPLAEMEPEEAFSEPMDRTAEAGARDRTDEAGEPAEAGAAPASAVEAPRATALLGVEATEEGVRVVADGRVGDADSFAIEDPARLVIDLPGLENRMTPAQVEVDDPRVARVRVGQHPDKVRVVVDAAQGSASLSDWTVTPLDDGLLAGPAGAGMAEAPEGDAAAPAAGAEDDRPAVAELEHARVGRMSTADGSPAESPEAGPAPAAPDAATTVADVDLHAGAGSNRVVIVTRGPASYQLFQPDDETVVVSLPDAALAAEADTRLAPDPGGPVSLVTAFQQPETERPEVRVVINRAAGLEPTVTREGANVVVAFQEGSGVAQTPPALEAESAQGAGSASASAKAMAQATAPSSMAPPAAGDTPGEQGIDVLNEGGLLDGKQYVGRRISLDFKDVEIDDVLRLIAEVSDLNIIAGDNVNGKVTIRLVDVPWDQALDVILLTKGLGFVKVGNVLRIAPQNLLQQEAEARLQERRAKEKLEDLIVKFQPVNYATVNDVAKMVQRLLSPRGTVNTDPRTNTVIIKDIPSVVDESVALIKAIDTPTPQVLIEAKIVEANLDFSRELGMVWGFGSQQYEDGFAEGTVSQERGSPDFRLRNQSSLLPVEADLNNFVINNPISQASDANALVNLGAFLLDQQFNLEAQLQAAESTGEGKVVSSPRVVTLDNREAEIQQGVAIPFQTFENGDAQLQFVDAVLQLKVKPHITADRSIIMQLEVSRNAPDDSVATNSGTPGINKNETKTETLVRDGQTLVIGGIYTVQKSDRENRVPYLHSIPLLGNLFKNAAVRDLRKELLIFVTPRIVEMPQLGS